VSCVQPIYAHIRMPCHAMPCHAMPPPFFFFFCLSECTLHPSEKMARVRTVAVVVPSPAMSFVLEATCRTSAAPMFTKLCCMIV
jgi:hypothetical protein